MREGERQQRVCAAEHTGHPGAGSRRRRVVALALGSALVAAVCVVVAGSGRRVEVLEEEDAPRDLDAEQIFPYTSWDQTNAALNPLHVIEPSSAGLLLPAIVRCPRGG